MGFDGWRFDYVKGFEPRVVKAWVEASGANAFDFACFYKMEDAFD